MQLAEAEAAKQKAAAAVAALAKVPTPPGPPPGSAPPPDAEGELFQLVWDDSVFTGEAIEELDEGERQAMDALRRGLCTTKAQLESHSTEVKAKLAQAKALAEQSKQRLAKKRKGPEGAAVTGQAQAEAAPTGGGGGVEAPVGVGASATAAAASDATGGGEEAARLAAEAAKLSEAKFRAAERAVEAGGGKGHGGKAAAVV